MQEFNKNEPTMDTNPPIFDLKPVTYSTVEKFIAILSPSKSCGIDDLTSGLIQDARECIIIPILHIINLSITSKCFPTLGKTHVVTPVYRGK